MDDHAGIVGRGGYNAAQHLGLWWLDLSCTPCGWIMRVHVRSLLADRFGRTAGHAARARFAQCGVTPSHAAAEWELTCLLAGTYHFT